MDSKISWGPVSIISGNHKGRIGDYDDDAVDLEGVERALVYFGAPLISSKYYLIPHDCLAPITTNALMKRRENLFKSLVVDVNISKKKKIELLEEFFYIELLLVDRMFTARLTKSKKGKIIFISHSSKDREFATWISVDLANYGHNPWMDEWEIKAGESIPRKIGRGIKECDFVVVILSKHAVKSRWVENEWHAKYWEEIKSGRVKVIPVLYKDCKIPTLLKTKKYADFRENNYWNGLEDLLVAVKD